jgi:hypothetical protein
MINFSDAEPPLSTAEPTYEDIATMQKHLNANFLSNPQMQAVNAMAI